jgi:hypothetical protein
MEEGLHERELIGISFVESSKYDCTPEAMKSLCGGSGKIFGLEPNYKFELVVHLTLANCIATLSFVDVQH